MVPGFLGTSYEGYVDYCGPTTVEFQLIRDINTQWQKLIPPWGYETPGI